jgi:predicted dehydrogenase
MTCPLLDEGCECAGYWTEGEPQPLAGFITRYPHIPRITDKRRLLEDPTVKLILTAAVNRDRAAIAIEAMQHGKDVMCDNGCHRRATDRSAPHCRRDRRIWSVNYSERFEVLPSRAVELATAGRSAGCGAMALARTA